MAYEQKPGTGSIFRNERKEKESHPDYRGTILTPDGRSYDLSLWVKTSQKGKKYFSVSCQEPYQKDEASKPQQEAHTDTTDDLPF